MSEELENSNENEEIIETPKESDAVVDTRDIVESELSKLDDSSEEVEPEPKEEPEPPKYQWQSWKKEAAEELNKLPPHVQDIIAERESQFHKGLEQYRESANFARRIDKTLNPYRDFIGRLQAPVEDVIGALMNSGRILTEGTHQEKVEIIQKILHDYKIDLGAVANTPFNPQLAYYKDQLSLAQRQLDDSNQFKQEFEQSQITSAISEFAQQHPFFEDVRHIMADLIEKGLANDIDEAYNKAIRLNDDVFAKMQTQQQSTQQNTTLNQANQAAKAAKQAAVQVKGAPRGVNNKAVPKTTEEAVRQAMLEHGL